MRRMHLFMRYQCIGAASYALHSVQPSIHQRKQFALVFLGKRIAVAEYGDDIEQCLTRSTVAKLSIRTQYAYEQLERLAMLIVLTVLQCQQMTGFEITRHLLQAFFER